MVSFYLTFCQKMGKSYTSCPYVNSSIRLILRVVFWEKGCFARLYQVFPTLFPLHLSQFLPTLIPKRNYGLLCNIILAMSSSKLAKFFFKTWFPANTSCNREKLQQYYFFHKGEVEKIINLRAHVEVALNIEALFNISGCGQVGDLLDCIHFFA